MAGSSMTGRLPSNLEVRSWGMTMPAKPTPPGSRRFVEGVTYRGRPGGRCGGARYRKVLSRSTPGFLRKRCGRPMLPEVRCRVPPSTCRPLTITPESNACAKIGCVVSYERAPKRCPNGHRLGPHRVVVGWTPCTCATALRPSGASGHRTYLCIVCEAEIAIPPHTGPRFSGVQWPPRPTQEQPRRDSEGERAGGIADGATRQEPEN